VQLSPPDSKHKQLTFERAVKRLSRGDEAARHNYKTLQTITAPLPGREGTFLWDRFRVLLYPNSQVLLTLTWASPREGKLLLYNREGRIISQANLPRLETIRQIDLDADGVCELLIESYGAGTGFSLRKFHIFRVDRLRGIQEVWSDTAKSTEPIDSHRIRKVFSRLSIRFNGVRKDAELFFTKKTEIRKRNGQKVTSTARKTYWYAELREQRMEKKRGKQKGDAAH